MNTDNLIEVELLNGKRILIEKRWDKVYDIIEKYYNKLKFKHTFPFFTFEKIHYVKFTLQTTYQTARSRYDKVFKVNCTLIQFALLFGVKIPSFDVAKIKSDVECEN